MKTIMLSDEAYEKLASIKGKKSFTEVVSELVDEVKRTKLEDLEEFFGIIGDEEARELHKITKQIRKRAKARIYETSSR